MDLFRFHSSVTFREKCLPSIAYSSEILQLLKNNSFDSKPDLPFIHLVLKSEVVWGYSLGSLSSSVHTENFTADTFTHLLTGCTRIPAGSLHNNGMYTLISEQFSIPTGPKSFREVIFNLCFQFLKVMQTSCGEFEELNFFLSHMSCKQPWKWKYRIHWILAAQTPPSLPNSIWLLWGNGFFFMQADSGISSQYSNRRGQSQPFSPRAVKSWANMIQTWPLNA
jgi:hypothetical protein